MGNRLSGLWCKKTTTLHINNDPKQQQQTQITNDNSICNNNKSHRRKSGGAGGVDGFGGTFRFGSARRLSLTSCVSKDNNRKSVNKSTNSVISTVEQQYEELVKTPVPVSDLKQYESQTLPKPVKTTMKVNAQLPTTVKVSSPTNDDPQFQFQLQFQWINEVTFIMGYPLPLGAVVLFSFSIRLAQRNYLWHLQRFNVPKTTAKTITITKQN